MITDDIEHVQGGQTFFWSGEYEWDMNAAQTLDTQLNVFGDFEPKLSDASRDCDLLFLANIQPDLQRDVREQCGNVQVAALDSMNFWIEKTRDSLLKTIGVVDMVLMNDAELRMLTEEPNLMRAAAAVRAMGPRVVIAKQGEYGAALFTEDGFFALPAYPLETVRDPTGAGDSFAGGLMGYLDSQGRRDRRRHPAPSDGLRLDTRLVLGRGIRLRAGRAAHARRDRRPLRAVQAHHGDRLRSRHLVPGTMSA